MLREASAAGVRGVLHCFTGSHALAEMALEAGWYVSFSGIVTFSKYGDHELLRSVPDDRLLVESDSPYLAPVPHRGQRNEPAWVAATIALIARARGATPQHIAECTSRNALAFFGVALPTIS